MAANRVRATDLPINKAERKLLMPKTLAWLGGSTVATAAATFTHGPLLVVLVIFAAVVLAALVTTYVAAVFFTGPRKNLVALIKAWRWPRGGP